MNVYNDLNSSFVPKWDCSAVVINRDQHGFCEIISIKQQQNTESFIYFCYKVKFLLATLSLDHCKDPKSI